MHGDAASLLVVFPGEVHDQRRAVAVRLVRVTELAVLAATPGEEEATVGHRSRVEPTAADLDDLLADEGLHPLRRALVPLVAMPEAAELALAPGVHLSVAERGRVEAARADLRALLQVGDHLRRVLVPLGHVRPVAADAVLTVSPRVHRAVVQQGHGVAAAARHLRHLDVSQALHQRRLGAAVLVAVAQLAVHAAAPREQLARLRDRRGVVAAAGDLRDAEAPQLLHAARDVLPAIVSVAEPAVVASAPRVHVALLQQHHGVAGAARDLPHVAVP
mmetsp:Transcript_5797/g.22629  ORF Transcript_5797/g.22629 Transcript_5797/m.22629 type:complete len:275 (+) Transcript_5797:1620-2444(+)